MTFAGEKLQVLQQDQGNDLSKCNLLYVWCRSKSRFRLVEADLERSRYGIMSRLRKLLSYCR